MLKRFLDAPGLAVAEVVADAKRHRAVEFPGGGHDDM